MQLDFETRESWFDREIMLKDAEGEIIEELGEQPSLDDLREFERAYGERIDLWKAGLVCAECGSEINDRFGANPRGDILCWGCVTASQESEQADVRVNTDTTKATISESQLHEKSLCDYVVNVATGCRHGCKFCYVPTTPGYEAREEMIGDQADVDDLQGEWGSYLLYRDDLPERLSRDLGAMDQSEWKNTKRGRGVVMLSSGTDCYQDRRTAQITRSCVQELVKREIPVRILTRSPAVLRDKDLYAEHNDLVTVGSSIPCMYDNELVRAIEPEAPPPKQRLNALDELRKEGVQIYVSMSPTYPTMDEHDLRFTLANFSAINADVVFHEPINPRGRNFQMCLEATKKADRDDAVDALKKIQDTTAWTNYALKQINTVQRLGEEFDNIEVHSWPDRELIQETSGQLSQALRAMRKAVSPEIYTEGDAPNSEAQQALAGTSGDLQELV